MTHLSGRHAGVLVPLFSMPTSASWGIGEITDIAALSTWLRAAGQDLLQLLPLNEMAPGQKSPYSAITAMAIDPIHIGVHAVEEFRALGGEDAFDAASRDVLLRARLARRVDYAAIRPLKDRWMRAAFERFRQAELARETERAGRFVAHIAEQAWWLDEYALFRALHARHDEQPWMSWDAALRDRRTESLKQARRQLADEILFRQYLQWVADEQWQAARAAVPGVSLFGDLPFMVDTDSADVWANQELFRLDASVGVPPDAFSETGQNWGLPVYRWDRMRERDHAWLRARARRSADLYDGYRVDHLVGFYRTYAFPHDASKAGFTPADEDDQRALGEEVLGVFGETGVEIIAEDLGTVPDFVRASLAELGIRGYRVLRWEREWKQKGQPFRDPARYPPRSVATSGTHDTEPLAVWWEQADKQERAAILRLDALARRLAPDFDPAVAPFTPALRDALLEILFASGSDLLLLPIQDVFGWRDRINVPATVSDNNWTYRLPWPVEKLGDQEVVRERQATLRRWAERHGRTGAREPGSA
jgi:4-alpha-glucanotransferase